MGKCHDLFKVVDSDNEGCKLGVPRMKTNFFIGLPWTQLAWEPLVQRMC